MSLAEQWEIVDTFRALDSPSPQRVVDVDIAMMHILTLYDTEKHNKACGNSVRFPRYQNSYPNMTPEKELAALRQHYWARHRQLESLRRLIDAKQDAIEKSCTHAWERDFDDRGHRSHYTCAHCGAYR